MLTLYISREVINKATFRFTIATVGEESYEYVVLLDMEGPHLIGAKGRIPYLIPENPELPMEPVDLALINALAYHATIRKDKRFSYHRNPPR